MKYVFIDYDVWMRLFVGIAADQNDSKSRLIILLISGLLTIIIEKCFRGGESCYHRVFGLIKI